MILVPKLELFYNETNIFIEVNLKTLMVGNMLDSTSSITAIHLCTNDTTYELQPSKDNTHWFSKIHYTIIEPSSLELHVHLGSTHLVFNCGFINIEYIAKPKVC